NEAVQKSVERRFAPRRSDRCENEHADREPGEKPEVVVGKGKCQGGTARHREQHSHESRKFHLAFNYRLEAELFEGAFCSFGRSEVLIGAHLHVVKIVGTRRDYKRWKLFLLDGFSHFERVSLPPQRGDL